jgi:hypothetical protein
MSPFEQIENSRIRPVGMVITPYPEGAPGDTLRVSAHFAGKPITRITDFRVCRGQFDTVGISQKIDTLPFNLPDSIAFNYRIPDTLLDSVIRKLQSSPSFAPEFTALLNALESNHLEAFSGLDSQTIAAVIDFLNDCHLYCRFMFTAKTADGEELKIRKDFLVRYNSRFQAMPSMASRLPVNHNPSLRFVALYKVRGDRDSFNPNNPYQRRFLTTSYLQTSIPGTIANDTMEIDTGYSYFLGTDTGIVTYQKINGDTISDTNIDRYHIPYPVSVGASDYKDSLLAEEFSYTWFYERQTNTESSDDVDMALEESVDKPIIKFFPPLDISITECTIWVKISDYLNSSMIRPTGSAETCVHCVFRYTDAYKQALGY